MARSLIIYVSGIDGSGKSTIAKKLAELLQENGLPVVARWFRFPYFLTLPVLVLARLTGRTKAFSSGGKRFTVHFFENLQAVYKLLFAFDHALYYIAKYGPSKLVPIVIVSDRGPLDNLVDLLADTGDRRIDSPVVRQFLALQARGVTIFTKAGEDTLLARRPEARIDPKYRMRLLLYEALIKRHKDLLRPIVINTDKDSAENERVLKLIASIIANHYGHVGWAKKIDNPYLRALVAGKAFILANWLFQGVRIADSSENTFRLLLDSLAIITGVVTGSLSLAVGVFLVTHTISYILASNSPIALSYLSKNKPPHEALEKLRRYICANKPGPYIDKIIVFGSVIRGVAKRYSDIDMRVVRRKGLGNAFRALLWTMKLRIHAWKDRLPLDVFLTTPEKLSRAVSVEERGNIEVITCSEAGEH